LSAVERLRSIVATAPLVIFSLDAEGTILVSEGRGLEKLGLRSGEAVGQSVWNYYRHNAEVLDNCRRALSGETFDAITEVEGVVFAVHYEPLRDPSGRCIGTSAVAVDVTERRRAEEALRAEKERLAVTLRSIKDGVVATDTWGRVVLLNRVAERILGWSQAEVVGRPLASILRIEDERSGEPAPDPIERVLGSDAAPEPPRRVVVTARDGIRRTVEDEAAPIRDAQGTRVGAVLVLRDLTERRRLEDELVRAAKLESVGRLAAAIAHDWNNVLTAIMANVSLARRVTGEKDPVRPLLQEIDEAAQQACALANHILAFATGGVPIRERFAVGPVVRQAAEFAVTGANVRCAFEIPDDLWSVWADRSQIAQAIHGVVRNAQQAMPQGGLVAVRARNVVVTGEEPSLSPGRWVRIEIEDKGVGIPAALLPKVFDPFFTTRPGSTGLGLTTTASIVRQHRGHVTCRSEPDRGTTVVIWLPATPAPETPAPPVREPGEARRRGRVLVMDDQERIRDVVGRMLGHLGYDFDFAADGQEAIAFYERTLREGRRFDAVILDLTIPAGMGGKEAIERLLAIDPGVRAIVSSGYSNDPVMADHERYGFKALIAKPYRFEDLAAILERVLA
jgi:PAS domain S-box-containing protein